MKKLVTLLLFTSTLFAFSLSAQVSWCGNSYMFVKTTWYTGSNSYMQSGGKFHGANLGTFSEDFTLGGQLEVYKPQTTEAKMAYKIDGGTPVDISMPYKAASGNNSKHEGQATVSIANLSNGEHTIEVWFRHTASGTSAYDSNSGNNYKATFTVEKSTPLITLTAPSSVYIDEEITLNASAANVADPVIIYSVKAPDSDDFITITSPYQPTTSGIYTFKAEVTEGEGGLIAAADTKDVQVKTVPEPIVIKAENAIGWDNVYIFTWGTNSDGFHEMTLDNGWYTYTFERTESANFLFVNQNEWGVGEEKTDDIKNVAASTCYEIFDDNGAKVETINCDKLSTHIADTKNKNTIITTSKNQISVILDKAAQIALYSISGQLLHQENVNKHFLHTVKTGIYIIRIDGKSHKVVVQ